MELLGLDEEVFCDDAFDCYAWVEEALIEKKGEVVELAHLVPQLALLSQSLTKSIHTTLQQLAVTGPQMQHQLESMEQTTTPLVRQLDEIAAYVSSSTTLPEGESGHRRKREEERDLQYLMILHDAKQRLQACSQALVEAAKWGKNVRLCFAAIEEGEELGGITVDGLKRKPKSGETLAARIHEMRQSVEVLHEMPGADDRKRTLQSLCAQVELKMKPKLTMCLHEDHLPVAQMQAYLQLFESIKRKQFVQDEYCKCRPAHVHRLWFAYNEDNEEDKSVISGSFSQWIETFYAAVFRMLQRESANASDIFGASKVESVLVELLRSTLTPLTDSFRDRLTKEFSMAELLRVFQSSRSFTTQVIQLFRSLESGGLLDDEQGDTSSIARSTTLDIPRNILSSIFEPHQLFFTNFTQYASEALTDELLKLVPQFTIADDLEGEGEGEEASVEAFAQRLEDASKTVWSHVDESLQQCYTFTGGAAFPEAMEAIAVSVQQFSLALASVIPSIRKSCNVLKENASTNKSDRLLSGLHGACAVDWSKFHAALALLKACGAFESDLSALENKVTIRMREQIHQFLGGSDRSGGLLRSKKATNSDQDATSLTELLDPVKLIAAVVNIWLHDIPTRQTQLQQFSEDLMDSATTRRLLFADVRRSVREGTKEVQQLTYDTVFLHIAHVLERLPTNESWNKIPDSALGDLPTFSTLPQEYITMVADLLLSLLPQLEPFAESSSFQTAFLASQGLQSVCVVEEWTRLGHLLRLSPTEVDACQSIFDSSASEEEEGEEVNPSIEGKSATEFVDLWTTAVASGTLAALLTAICSIPALSDLGAKQLSADLGYFYNVLSAVGAERNFIVDDLRLSLEMTVSDHAHHVDVLCSEAESEADVEKHVLYKLNDCLLTKRQRSHKTTSLTATGAATSSNPQFF